MSRESSKLQGFEFMESLICQNDYNLRIPSKRAKRFMKALGNSIPAETGAFFAEFIEHNLGDHAFLLGFWQFCTYPMILGVL